jgi:hypothetical protein
MFCDPLYQNLFIISAARHLVKTIIRGCCAPLGENNCRLSHAAGTPGTSKRMMKKMLR